MQVKKTILILICLLIISRGVYSQSNTCDCYIMSADTAYPVVPLTQGTDIGYPPTYHCDDCSSQPIKLPFNFCFYGKDYDTVYINNKGNLTFVHPVYNFSSEPFPLGNDTLMLAPFYADIDDTPPNPSSISYAVISYKLTATHLIVQWSGVGYNTFDDDLYNNFQLTITNGADSILPASNNVSYCYWLMQWASGDSSGGTAGFAGIPATVGVNKGDHVHYAQFGAFDFPGTNYYSPSDTNNQVYWLDNKSFIFNTCVSGNNIPPVIIDPDLCDTVTECALDTALFKYSFLCSQQGQTATVIAYSPGLSGFTTTTSNAHSIYSISAQLIAHLKDTGMHVITVKATDNSSPALTDSIQFTVFIQPCGDTSSNLGINRITENADYTLYPNPNNGVFTIQMMPDTLLMLHSEIQIYNILGEKIYSTSFVIHNSPFTINLTGQPSGVYLYRLSDDSGNLLGMGKFVIE